MAALGDTLRKRRIEMGKTLADAEAATRIRARLLDALEDGAYDRLPNPAYVRGYITSYARWLELDAAPLLTLYRAEAGAVGPTSALPRREQVVVPREKAHAVPWKTAVLIAGVLLAVVLLVWGAGSLRRDEGPTPLPPASPASASTQTATPTTPGTLPTVEPGDAPRTVPFTLKVSVTSDGASWARITVDGKKAYEGTLVSGQSEQYEVAEEATVRIGKPSVVTVYRDGEKVELPEAVNTPEITLKAEPQE